MWHQRTPLFIMFQYVPLGDSNYALVYSAADGFVGVYSPDTQTVLGGFTGEYLMSLGVEGIYAYACSDVPAFARQRAALFEIASARAAPTAVPFAMEKVLPFIAAVKTVLDTCKTVPQEEVLAMPRGHFALMLRVKAQLGLGDAL